jgi:hypothetical protein
VEPRAGLEAVEKKKSSTDGILFKSTLVIRLEVWNPANLNTCGIVKCTARKAKIFFLEE